MKYKSTSTADFKEKHVCEQLITANEQINKTEGETSVLDIFTGASSYSRMSNSLNQNIAYIKDSKVFAAMTEEQKTNIILSDKKHLIDRDFKPVSLNVEEIRLIKTLSTYIPFNCTAQSIVVPFDQNGNPYTDKLKVEIIVDVLQLSKDIIGDTKEKSIRVIGERLLALASKEQCQIVWINGSKFMVTEPLLSIGQKAYNLYSEVRKDKRGRTSTKKEEMPLLVEAKVTLSPVFLNNMANRFSPFHKDKYLAVTKKNKTELFAILEADLGAKWLQYIANYHKTIEAFATANKELKRSNRAEYDKQLQAESLKALTYKASVDTVKSRVSTDYSDHRQAKARFWEHLNGAITSLIEYGIITDKTHISRDKKFVHFSYNPNFAERNERAENLLESV